MISLLLQFATSTSQLFVPANQCHFWRLRCIYI